MSAGSFRPLAAAAFKNAEYHENLTQIVITTTEDKLKNQLHDFKSAHAKVRGWGLPLGLFVSILSALLTATFREAFGKPAAFWEAAFNIACIVAFVWTVVAIIQALCCLRAASIDTLIMKIKNKTDV